MMAVMLPLFFLAMYEKDGQPLEVVAKHFYERSSRGRKRGLTKRKITMHCWFSRQTWKWKMCIRDRYNLNIKLSDKSVVDKGVELI